jgi:hypothetical protein
VAFSSARAQKNGMVGLRIFSKGQVKKTPGKMIELSPGFHFCVCQKRPDKVLAFFLWPTPEG